MAACSCYVALDRVSKLSARTGGITEILGSNTAIARPLAAP